MIGSFLYPSDLSLASCTTTFCLCKSCQRTLSSCSLPCGDYHRFFRKRVQRYCFFPNWQNFSGVIFRKRCIFIVWMTEIKANWQNTDNMSGYCENIDGDAYDGYLQIMRGEPNSVQKNREENQISTYHWPFLLQNNG